MPKKSRGPRLRPSISLVLTGGVGLLMLLAGIAYSIAMLSGRLNTVELLRDRNERIVNRLVERTQLQLDPVRQRVAILRDRLQSRQLGINDVGRLSDYMVASLDGLPQVDALAFIRNDLVATRAVRNGGQIVMRHDSVAGYPGSAVRMQTMRRAFEAHRGDGRLTDTVIWGDLIWSPELQQPLINVLAPVVVDDVFVGELAALVSLGSLSRILEADSIDERAVNFILYGNDQVLAHPTLLNHKYELSLQQPLPTLAEIHDSVLRQIWSGRTDIRLARPILGNGESHIVEANGRRWIFVYRRLEGYGDKPWLIGRYFSFDEIDKEVTRLQISAAIGAVALVLSLLIAWRISWLLRRPVLSLSDAANRLRNLDFDAPPLDRVRLRELDDAAQAFNAATAALRWFGNYVPRKLVNRLLREGEEAVNISKYREVTVVFTDLVGFTAMSERLTAQETADLLNDHFALLTTCIEAEGGIVDKFIGDAVMAVWGAIKRDDDHAAHACKAVQAIGAAVAADNARRVMLGKPVLRMRIGVHSGPVVIGNIGAPGRINYTVVGDTVNTAQRLEQLGHEHLGDDQNVIALASAETVEAARLDPKPPCVGRISVKGRAASVEVYRLEL
ncbi:MAG TPA: adenylate/guanylate cyclase domain-containing protein [Ferrovibrio sp.]|uniref:adenylate/guanylate cyclase domain-containing protein n=1 Tax=Ferrovibrio sp. TaxID=1917215 RepID=UPI002ED23567